ncbi:MAG: hypothetical protein HY318_00870 [Armatimonadetes bacterium]|nr:hypothetical protein [Armatimonadota bacterium]
MFCKFPGNNSLNRLLILAMGSNLLTFSSCGTRTSGGEGVRSATESSSIRESSLQQVLAFFGARGERVKVIRIKANMASLKRSEIYDTYSIRDRETIQIIAGALNETVKSNSQAAKATETTKWSLEFSGEGRAPLSCPIEVGEWKESEKKVQIPTGPFSPPAAILSIGMERLPPSRRLCLLLNRLATRLYVYGMNDDNTVHSGRPLFYGEADYYQKNGDVELAMDVWKRYLASYIKLPLETQHDKEAFIAASFSIIRALIQMQRYTEAKQEVKKVEMVFKNDTSPFLPLESPRTWDQHIALTAVALYADIAEKQKEYPTAIRLYEQLTERLQEEARIPNCPPRVRISNSLVANIEYPLKIVSLHLRLNDLDGAQALFGKVARYWEKNKEEYSQPTMQRYCEQLMDTSRNELKEYQEKKP